MGGGVGVGPQLATLPAMITNKSNAAIARLLEARLRPWPACTLRSCSEGSIILSSWSFPYTEGTKDGFDEVFAGSLPCDLAQSIHGSAHVDGNQVDELTVPVGGSSRMYVV